MLHIENKYATPIESNYYQNKENSKHFDKSNSTKNITDYSEQELNLKKDQARIMFTKLQQIKYNHLKKKIGQPPFS